MGNNPAELSSAWYVFTAANAGNLEFTITPNHPKDDIDFVLYRLPNGPGDCSGKIWERCMRAGDQDYLSPCMGPTGLNATALDITQPAGCTAGMDNFLKSITLIPGATYALAIDNYTSFGTGFTLEWGGDAIFQGEITANFTTDDPDQIICLGEELEVTDSSYTLNGMLASWSWDFGSGAVTDSTLGKGPHVVQYQTLGPKQIILSAMNTEGCIGLDTAFLWVEQCCSLEATVNRLPGCPYNPPTPAIATVEVHNTLAAIQTTWSNGQSGNFAAIDTSGNYSVLVEDENGCVDSVEFSLNTPLNINIEFPVDTSILLGDAITLGVYAMPSQSLSVWWINPENDTLLDPVQIFSPSQTTTYVIVVNHSGCIFTDTLTVEIEQPSYQRPNAFSPNGDGSNDTFGPILIGHSLLQLEIWTRWGEKVFDSVVLGRDVWDGTIQGVPAASDVYVYRMRVRQIDGQERVDKGEVTLLR
jgi:gliding motility-associated-like protein